MFCLLIAVIFIFVVTILHEVYIVNIISDDPPLKDTVLVQRGPMYYVYTPDEFTQPPLVFSDIYKYRAYVDMQSELGTPTPMLFLREILGPQGEFSYSILENPFNPLNVDYRYMEGMTSSPVNPNIKHTSPYDRKIYMDNLAYSISNALSVNQINAINKLELTKSVLASEPSAKCRRTAEDIVPITKNGLTADPMTRNWGGVAFTQKMIGDGYYEGNEVIRYPSNVKK